MSYSFSSLRNIYVVLMTYIIKKKSCVTKIKHDLFNYHMVKNLIQLELIGTQLC